MCDRISTWLKDTAVENGPIPPWSPRPRNAHEGPWDGLYPAGPTTAGPRHLADEPLCSDRLASAPTSRCPSESTVSAGHSQDTDPRFVDKTLDVLIGPAEQIAFD